MPPKSKTQTKKARTRKHPDQRPPQFVEPWHAAAWTCGNDLVLRLGAAGSLRRRAAQRELQRGAASECDRRRRGIPLHRVAERGSVGRKQIRAARGEPGMLVDVVAARRARRRCCFLSGSPTSTKFELLKIQDSVTCDEGVMRV